MKRLIYGLLLVLAFNSNLHAQKRKELYFAIDSLLKQQEFYAARPLIRNMLQDFPDNALATYLLGKSYQLETTSLYLHEAELMAQSYDSTMQIYERAKLQVGKKDLRKNKAFYEEIFGTKEYEMTDVTALIDAEIVDMEDYFGKVSFIKVRLQTLQDYYRNNEIDCRALLSRYPKQPEMYLRIQPEEIDLLKGVVARQERLNATLSDYEGIFKKDSVWVGHQYQAFSWQPVVDGNIYGLSEKDFKKRKLALFQYGNWAQEALDRIHAYRQIKKELTDVEKSLAQTLASQSHQADTGALSYKTLRYLKELATFDPNATLAPVLHYQLAKIKFLQQEEVARKAFGQSFSDIEHRNAIIGPIVAQLQQLLKLSERIPEEIAGYELYEELANTAFGSAEKIAAYKAGEAEFVNQHLLHWNSIRAKAVTLRSSVPDIVAFGNQQLLMRPAKFNMRVAVDSGYFINEQTIFLQDSSMLVRGRYGKEALAFLALLDTGGKVQWLRTDYDTAEKTLSIEQIMVYPAGQIAYFAKRKKAGAERFMLVVLNMKDGLPSYSRMVRGVPEQVYMAPEAPGIFFVYSTEKGQSGNSFKEIEIEGYKFGQDKGTFVKFMLRGHVVATVAQPKRLRMVANFLEYQDLDGNFADSRAYNQGGFNVMVVTVPLDGKPAQMKPMLSMVPIIATHVESEADGKLWLQGFEGDYRYLGPGNITGGKPWQKYTD